MPVAKPRESGECRIIRGLVMNWATLIEPAAVAAVVSGVVSLAGSLLSLAVAERRLRREFRLELAAEHAARTFLRYSNVPSRSFDFIKQRLRGFEDDELRKILVRAGAVHFTNEENDERWGLLQRNRHLSERTDQEMKISSRPPV
jgi:hypothetical protein